MKSKIFILMYLIISFFIFSPTASFAQTAGSNNEYNEFLDASGWYGGMVKFFHAEAASQDSRIPADIKSIAVYIVVDILVSIICLWIALYFVAALRGFDIKNYFSFLVAVNIGWYVVLILNYFCWGMLDFLVLRLRPEMKGGLVDFFSVAVLVESAILYIWLLARNFSLDFFGAIGTFLVSQAIYFVVLFIFSVAAPKSCFYCNIINMNLGFVVSVREYLHDVFKVSSHEGLLSLLRFRAFHM